MPEFPSTGSGGSLSSFVLMAFVAEPLCPWRRRCSGAAVPAAKVKVSGLGGSLSPASWRKRGLALGSGFR